MKMQSYIAESSDSESELSGDDDKAWLALCALPKLTLGSHLNLQNLSDLECDKLSGSHSCCFPRDTELKTEL